MKKNEEEAIVYIDVDDISVGERERERKIKMGKLQNVINKNKTIDLNSFLFV